MLRNYFNYLANTAGFLFTFSKLHQYHRLTLSGKGGMGGKGGWEGEGGLYHTLEQKSSHCVLIKVQKQPQYISQAEMGH